jgi:hypothetical protein
MQADHCVQATLDEEMDARYIEARFFRRHVLFEHPSAGFDRYNFLLRHVS